MNDGNREQSWTVMAALLGFLSGAGVMSHADVVSLASSELYSFLQTDPDGTVVLHTREFVTMFGFLGCYSMVLFLILAVLLRSLQGLEGVGRWAAAGGVFLILSFVMIAGYGVARGYHEADERVGRATAVWHARRGGEGPVPVRWIVN